MTTPFRYQGVRSDARRISDDAAVLAFDGELEVFFGPPVVWTGMHPHVSTKGRNERVNSRLALVLPFFENSLPCLMH